MSNEAWASALDEAGNPDARDSGLWAKCFAEADGDEAKAKASYVKNKIAMGAEKARWICPSCSEECGEHSSACKKCGANLSSLWRPVLKKSDSEINGISVGLVKPAKSRGVYIILGIFFGILGIHNIYIGRFFVGAAQFLITTILGWFYIGIVITFFWVMIDIFSVKSDSAGDALV